MSIRRFAGLTLSAAALAVGGLGIAHGLAQAGQNRIVVQRFLLGYFDRKARFVPTAGSGAQNVDRNSHAVFVFSGAVESGPNRQATLPLTLAEQAALDALIRSDPDYDPRQDGYEPGAIPRKRSEDPSAFYVATGSVSPDTIEVTVPSGVGSADAKGKFFKVLRTGTRKPHVNRLLFNPRYVESVLFIGDAGVPGALALTGTVGDDFVQVASSARSILFRGGGGVRGTDHRADGWVSISSFTGSGAAPPRRARM